MKKHLKTVVFILTVLLLCCFSSAALGANIAVSVDGIAVNFSQSTGFPYIDGNNRTLVPLRGVMEKYGCSVEWQENSQTAVVSQNGTVVKVSLGVDYIYVNSKKVSNDTEAVIKNDRVYLPIRAVLEAFGAQVIWDDTTATVVVLRNCSASSQYDLQVHFIDVGQADAILIDYKDYEILIDAGDEKSGGRVADYLRQYVDGDLEMVIATHADSDHIGGIPDVLAEYQVDRIIDSGEVKDTAACQKYRTAAAEEPNCIFEYDEDMTIQIGDSSYLQIIETGDDYADSNNNSVVAMLVYNNVKALFVGDMESEAERANLPLFSDVDVLKAGHHGSSTSSCKEFLQVVKPEYVVISAGADNPYGHPKAQALRNFFDINAKALGTFKSGDIVMMTNGVDYIFNTENFLTIEDAGAKSANSGGYALNETVYIGNKNTKKFHKPTCRYAKNISAENIVYFKGGEQAVGYEPCKICNP